MRAQTILFLLVERFRGRLDCRPYRDGGEGNPKRLVEAASRAFSNRSNIFTIRDRIRESHGGIQPIEELLMEGKKVVVFGAGGMVAKELNLLRDKGHSERRHGPSHVESRTCRLIVPSRLLKVKIVLAIWFLANDRS